MTLFRDRREAGRELARRLSAYAGRGDVIVLALPRGGVPVASEIAQALDAPLDVFLVRKLGVPGHEELAMGAIASGGARVLDSEVVGAYRISDQEIGRVTAIERQELDRRERAYRGGRPPLALRGRTAILVDDGLATGSSMRAALAALGPLEPARTIVAVPVAPRSTVKDLKNLADEIVCVATPEPFLAVGMFYEDFEQTDDEEVRALLALRKSSQKASGKPKAGESMRNRLVPRAEWFSFLKGFSRRHEDDPVTVQVLAPGLGSQVEARALPLEGIMAGRRTSGPISISVGRTPDRHVEHEVPDPNQVWVQMSEDGAERALDIESQDGTRTIVQLEPEPQAKPRHLLPR